MQLPPSVCQSVLPSVSSLFFKPTDLWPWSFTRVGHYHGSQGIETEGHNWSSRIKVGFCLLFACSDYLTLQVITALWLDLIPSLAKCACSKVKTLIISDHKFFTAGCASINCFSRQQPTLRHEFILFFSQHHFVTWSTATQYRCWPPYKHRLSIRNNWTLQCWHSTCINMHTHIWWWRSEGQRGCVSACIKRPGWLREIIE